MITVDNSNIKILIVDDTAENLEIAGKIQEMQFRYKDMDISIPSPSGPRRIVRIQQSTS